MKAKTIETQLTETNQQFKENTSTISPQHYDIGVEQISEFLRDALFCMPGDAGEPPKRRSRPVEA